MQGGAEALLRAALLPAEDAHAAWRAWLAGRQGPLDDASQRLLPLVYRNLEAHLAEVDRAALEAAYRASWLAVSAQLDALAEALAALSGAGIPAIALKGVSLALLFYPDPGARPMSDVDLLVPEARAEEARDVLCVSGWRTRRHQAWGQRRQHATTLGHPRGAILDLHRHAIYTDHAAGTDADFWQRAVPLRVGDQQALALSPADQFLHSLVHGQRWSRQASVSWLADAVQILRRGAALDWSALEAEATRRRRLAAVQNGLRSIEALLPGTLPAAARSLLSRPTGIADRLEFHCSSREPAGPLGSLPNEWFAYARWERGRGARATPARFVAWLKQAWHADERGWRAVLKRKLRARLGRLRRGGRITRLPPRDARLRAEAGA